MTPELEQPESGGRPAVASGSLVRAVSWMGAGHIAAQLSVFGSIIVLAALVPPSAFGTVAAGTVMVNVAILLMDAGTRGRIITSDALSRDEIRRSVAANVTVALVVAIAAVLLAGPIVSTFADGGDPQVLRALFLSIVPYAFAIVPLALLQKELSFKQHAGVTAGAGFLAAALGLLAGLLGADVWALVLRQVLSTVFLAAFAWVAARRLIARFRPGKRRRESGRVVGRLFRGPAIWFFLVAAAHFVAFNVDTLIVGALGDAESVGLYALAFMIAFAPLVQVSWQVGKVLFPAAAAESDPRVVERRTASAMRFMALGLLPLLPPAIALAPVVFPGVLGDEWEDMVLPFQLLVVAGVGHAIVNCIGESLSGAGHIAFLAKVNVMWVGALLVAVAVLVEIDGLTGAALAHLVLFVPFTVAYVVGGGRLLGLRARQLGAALAPVAGPVTAQAVVTVAVAVLLPEAGASADAAAVVATVAGACVLAAILLVRRDGPLREVGGLVAAARRREAA
jgi:O-antigen/teichoic acid export membrane protein